MFSLKEAAVSKEKLLCHCAWWSASRSLMSAQSHLMAWHTKHLWSNNTQCGLVIIVLIFHKYRGFREYLTKKFFAHVQEVSLILNDFEWRFRMSRMCKIGHSIANF